MMKFNCLFIITFLLNFCSFAQFNLTTTIKSDTIDLVLAMEVCPSGQFSFCYDGFEQPLRGKPFLVSLDNKCFLNSYKGDVYTIVNPNVLFDTFKNNARFKDSLLNFYASGSKLISFNSGKFRNKVNRSFKKKGIDVKFDGLFYYKLIHVKATRKALGQHTILLPALFDKNSNVVIKSVKCDLYFLDKIISVSSIE